MHKLAPFYSVRSGSKTVVSDLCDPEQCHGTPSLSNICHAMMLMPFELDGPNCFVTQITLAKSPLCSTPFEATRFPEKYSPGRHSCLPTDCGSAGSSGSSDKKHTRPAATDLISLKL